MAQTLEKYIIELLDPQKPIINARLKSLSYLAPEELLLFRKSWKGAPLKRKLEVLERIILISSENSSLNFDELFTLCLKDTSPEVRAKALEGLSGTEETQIVRQAVKMLLEDVDEKVRAAACDFLAPVALKVELKLLPESLSHQVETALQSTWENEGSSIECKCCALESLSYICKPYILEAIEKAYQSKNKELKTSSLIGMGRSLEPRWIPILIKELSNPDEMIRLEAVNACGEIAHETLVPHLLPLLQDPETTIKFAAIVSLGHIGGTMAEENLRSLIKSEEREIQEAARDALEELLTIRDPFRIPILD